MKDDTLALLVAGRALDLYLVTYGMLARLREIAATVPDLTVIVAGDRASSSTPDDPLYARVVIGYVAACVQSEYELEVTADPLAIDPEVVDTAIERARSLDAVTWARLAAVLPRTNQGFSAAQRRAALTAEQRKDYANVAFDGPELCATPDRIHLVASGRLAGAVLARGEVRPLPFDDEEELDDGWVYHGGNNERPRHGVFGDKVARVHVEDHGAIALSPDQLVGSLFLLAVYD